MTGPKSGDICLHCGHLKKGTAMSVHLIMFEGMQSFSRPDGTRGEAKWFASCEACFLKHGMKVADLPQGELQWDGDEPVVEPVNENGAN
jgi:hypothetical protein